MSSSGGAGGGAPVTSKYVVSQADASLSAEIVIPGLAGSRDVASVGGAGTSREFESGDAAPTTWSPSAPDTVNVGTTYPSHLYIKTTDSTERFGYYDWSPAAAFDARCRVVLGNLAGTSGGDISLYIANTDNSLRTMLTLFFNTRVLTIQALSFSTSYTQRGSSWLNSGQPVYMRITRDGSNNVTWFWSNNGMVWTQIATLSFTFTVARLGFRLANDQCEAVIDWLRTDV